MAAQPIAAMTASSTARNTKPPRSRSNELDAASPAISPLSPRLSTEGLSNLAWKAGRLPPGSSAYRCGKWPGRPAGSAHAACGMLAGAFRFAVSLAVFGGVRGGGVPRTSDGSRRVATSPRSDCYDNRTTGSDRQTRRTQAFHGVS
jgi:hypothetical protein